MSRITLGNFMTPNRLCENCRSGMSRPWTRASNMANGLLKKIALAGMVGTSALLGAKEAKAVTIPWNSVSDIVANAANYPQYGGSSANYSANSITFRDQNGNVIANNPMFSLVYIANFSNGSSAIVGGLARRFHLP